MAVIVKSRCILTRVLEQGITEIGRASMMVEGEVIPDEVLRAETLAKDFAAPHVNFYDPSVYKVTLLRCIKSIGVRVFIFYFLFRHIGSRIAVPTHVGCRTVGIASGGVLCFQPIKQVESSQKIQV